MIHLSRFETHDNSGMTLQTRQPEYSGSIAIYCDTNTLTVKQPWHAYNTITLPVYKFTDNFKSI